MGLGPIKNGKHTPITKWENSWAYQEQQRKLVSEVQKPKEKPNDRNSAGH